MEMQGIPLAAPYEIGAELSPSQWRRLEEGQYVLVRRQGEALRGGEVDVLNYHATIFWVQLDDGQGRIAIYDDEDIRVCLPKGCQP